MFHHSPRSLRCVRTIPTLPSALLLALSALFSALSALFPALLRPPCHLFTSPFPIYFTSPLHILFSVFQFWYLPQLFRHFLPLYIPLLCKSSSYAFFFSRKFLLIFPMFIYSQLAQPVFISAFNILSMHFLEHNRPPPKLFLFFSPFFSFCRPRYSILHLHIS